MNEANAPKTKSTAEFLLDIASILYQVNEPNLAAEMILDTITEKLKISYAGIFNQEKNHKLMMSAFRGFDQSSGQNFLIHPDQPLNGKSLKTETYTFVELQNNILQQKDNKTELATIENLLFLPLRYQEKLIGFLCLGSKDGELFKNADLIENLSRLATVISPVLFALDSKQTATQSFENIISKIIKDRVHEARLSLNPISFCIYRLVFREQFVDSLVLEEVIKSYQNAFSKTLISKGDLIWLTADTAFFMYNNADLFEAEALNQELKENLKTMCKKDQMIPVIALKHASISYPQSGDNVTDIINNLWLKLFEDIYLMEE